MPVTHDQKQNGAADIWPALAFDEWKDTCETLQLWTQIVGKVRLKLAPMVNHWWQVTLYVTATGLTTSAMPYRGRFVQIDFDFLAHRLILRTSNGRIEQFALEPYSVADFYAEVMGRLRALGIDVHIWTMPSEIEDAIPFEQDRLHVQYDPVYVERFWRALLQADRVMTSLQTALASAEANYRKLVAPGFEWLIGVRYLDIREGDPLDEAQLATWVKQAAALPGWVP